MAKKEGNRQIQGLYRKKVENLTTDQQKPSAGNKKLSEERNAFRSRALTSANCLTGPKRLSTVEVRTVAQYGESDAHQLDGDDAHSSIERAFMALPFFQEQLS